jgi:hypothetical protein
LSVNGLSANPVEGPLMPTIDLRHPAVRTSRLAAYRSRNWRSIDSILVMRCASPDAIRDSSHTVHPTLLRYRCCMKPFLRVASTQAGWATLPSGAGPHSIAIRVSTEHDDRLLMGEAMVGFDAELGDVMRVTFPSSLDEVLILPKYLWHGQTESGAAFNCDLFISISSHHRPH